jgi:uncharacterized damage-inducible protein DinB
MSRTLAAAILLLVGAQPVTAQQTGANPYTAAVKAQAEQIRHILLRAADKIPEELLAFRPTPEVRSLGALFGHIADGNELICRIAAGEKPSFAPVHEKKTTKAELVAALKQSDAFCDSVFAKLDDATGRQTVSMFGRDVPRLMVLAFNNNHAWEHYGNIVTYMRLNKIVPPTSEQQPPSGGRAR